MRKLSLILALSLAAFAVDSQGGGDLNTHKLESAKVEALMSDLETSQQSKSVTILDETTLLRSSPGTGGIQASLENAPGVLYSRAGGLGGVISMRGMLSSTDTTMITLDETRVYGRAALEYNVFDPDSIDSIEIIRGPASALFGSNAMNGVINIKSRRFKGDVSQPFNMAVKLRSLDYSSVNNGVGGRLEAIGGGDGWDILVGLNGRKAGDFRTPEGKAEHSKFNSWGVDYNIGYTYNDTRYYTQGRYARVSNENPGGVRMLTFPAAGGGSALGIWTKESPLTELYLRSGVEVSNLSFAEKMDAFVYWRRYDTDLYNHIPTSLPFYNIAPTHMQVKSSNYVGGRLAFETKLDNHSLGYGLDTTNTITKKVNRRDHLPAGNTQMVKSGNPNTQSEIGIFFKDDYTATENLILSGSIRGDLVYSTSTSGEGKKDNTTSAITSALGAVYFFTPEFSSGINLSRNFIAPWVGYTTSLVNSGALPNPNLKPEYSHTAELSFRYEDDDNMASIAAYYTQYKNKIDNLPVNPADPNSETQWQNLDKSYIQGVEWQGSHKLPYSFTLAYLGGATYGQDKTYNIPLAYVPPLYGRISLAYDMPWGYVKVQERAYKGKTRVRNDGKNFFEKKTKSYAMTDVYLGLDLGYFQRDMKDMELTFGVENLFDQKGRNPATVSNSRAVTTKTNPLLEPGINAFVKYSYKY